MRALRWVIYTLLPVLPATAGILSSSGSVTIGGGASLCSGSSSSTLLATNNCSNGTTSGEFKAQSDYGVLKAYSTFNSIGETANVVEILANAGFTDFIHLTSSGAPSTIDFVFTITGSGFSGADASMRLSASSSTGGGPFVQTGGAGVYTFTTNYAPLIPADDYTLVLTASLQARAFFDNGGPGPWTGTATSDFFSTATLSSVIVYDASHNDISNTVSINGGASSYNLGGGGAVPEPSTMLMTAGGAALAFFARRSRG